MSENLRHWDALFQTNPAHTKGFQRAGGFKGTAIKPIYMTQKMTEHFGPCGIGWGMDKPEFTTITVGEEILVYCTTALWYVDTRDAQTIGRAYGVGGDKAAVKRRDGRVDADDEAFKKAYTDALSNAMKQLGVSADVHMGLFEDSKYMRELAKEFAEETPAPPPRQSPAPEVSPPQTGSQADPVGPKTALTMTIASDIDKATDVFKLDKLMADTRNERLQLSQAQQGALVARYEKRRSAMMEVV